MNVDGFLERRPYIIPQDGKNLNRLFPGNHEGTLGDKIAYLLTEEFHESCRCYWQRMLGVDCISKELDFTIRYHVQGCFALIRHWCENDFDLSIEAMTAMITNIDNAVTTYVKKTQDNKIGGGSYVVN